MARPHLLRRHVAQPETSVSHERRAELLGWVVHLLTASGAVVGMFAITAVVDGAPRTAVMWLIVAIVIDGLDGPIARAIGIRERVPRIDGYALDLVVDYVTCIVVPVLFLAEFDLLPNGSEVWIGAGMIFVGALWMARTDQTTDDHWFNGFPGEWSVVVPTLWLLDATPTVTAVVCVGLTLTQFTNIKFVHVVQVRRLRRVTVPVNAAWGLAVLAGAARFPLDRSASLVDAILVAILIAAPAYTIAIGAWRTVTGDANAAAHHLAA
jgi:phosphatidylcholine synthase